MPTEPVQVDYLGAEQQRVSIVFSRWKAHRLSHHQLSEQGLRILNLDDGSIAQLTMEWDNFPFWSPKGDRIAFIRRTGTDFQIFTIRPDGREPDAADGYAR